MIDRDFGVHAFRVAASDVTINGLVIKNVRGASIAVVPAGDFENSENVILSNNVIGDCVLADGNTGTGISIEGNSQTVGTVFQAYIYGNRIQCSQIATGNARAISVLDAVSIAIGKDENGVVDKTTRNVISNSDDGVAFLRSRESGLYNNQISSHFGDGVIVSSSDFIEIIDNDITDNGGNGITQIGAAVANILVREGRIGRNTNLPIDLGNNGFTANDPGDNYVDFPENLAFINGAIEGTACSFCRVQVWNDEFGDWLGEVQADGSGEWRIEIADLLPHTGDVYRFSTIASGTATSEMTLPFTALPTTVGLSEIKTDTAGRLPLLIAIWMLITAVVCMRHITLYPR